jgi:glycosyltransferase involved in cell wall biosynthesis
VTTLELRRNFGKAVALQIGFHQARGQIIVTMDGDLQDDPLEIPRFLAALEESDVVSGWKQNRQDPLEKTLPSRFFNVVTAALTQVPLRDFNCGFKAYRREVVQSLDLYGELHRYIPVLAFAKGFRIAEIPVHHLPRRHGRSKYGRERLVRGAFDLMTVLLLSVYRYRPLHLFGMVGFASATSGLLIDLYLTMLWFLGDRPIGNRPLLTLGSLLIMLGIQVLMFGLIAEMITAATYRRGDVMDLVRTISRGSAGNDVTLAPSALGGLHEQD